MSFMNEVYRKSLHFLLIVIPLLFIFLGRWKALLILALITVTVISFDYLRTKSVGLKAFLNKNLKSILRKHEIEDNKMYGLSWSLLGASISFFFFKLEIAVTGFLILVFSDAIAAIVGIFVPSKPFFEKSVAGSAAFFVSAIVVLIICGTYFDSNFLFFFFGAIVAFCVTIIEARPSFLAIDDNFSIPVAFSVVMTMFDFMWNFTSINV